MILYVENPKDISIYGVSEFSIRKLLELISKVSKVTGSTINIQKSLAFLCTSNEKSETEIKKTIPFTIATKRIQYLGINLPKDKKELYIENCKALMRKIKDDINRWIDIPCFWVGRINIVKMSILLNAIYRFSVIPNKLPMGIFRELEESISQFYGNTKDPEQPKQSSERRMGLEQSAFLILEYTTKL